MMYLMASMLMTGGGLAATEPARPALLEPGDAAFLEELTAAVVAASRVAPGAKVGGVGPNVTGGTLVRPGGRDCYPAFWIRDYAMSLDSGLITPEEQRHAILVTAGCQPDAEMPLRSGSVVPAGAIADHISLGGKPIFYPGVLEDYEGQGGPQWGKWPSYDDHYYFVLMVQHYIDTTGDVAILDRVINGKPLIQRMQEAYAVPPSRPDTQLVYAEPESRGVNFGFFDTVVHTGELLFVSVLKRQAAQALAGVLDVRGDAQGARLHADAADAIGAAIPAAFALEDRLLRASTGESAQPDVWGTAYAVYAGALDAATQRAACEALAREYAAGAIAWKGMIRHVPTHADFSATSAWEHAYARLNTYQNGAYWETPTGWVCYAIAQVDRAAAARLAREYVAALREDDFRLGPDHGAPWECMHPDGGHRQNPVYMASVTCPLAALRRLE